MKDNVYFCKRILADMGLLDNITTEDNRIDSAGVLASDVDLSKDKEYDYKYWLFAMFDNLYSYSTNTEERIYDCFESCVQVHNYDIEYVKSEQDTTSGILVWLGDLKWPHIRVMFNLKRNDAGSVIRFMTHLFKFLDGYINGDWRDAGIRSVNIVNWRNETYREYMRYDFSRYKQIRNYSEPEVQKNDILKLFGIDYGAQSEQIEKLTLWDENRKFLYNLRDSGTKNLKIVVNYLVQNLRREDKPFIMPIEIYGKNYTELIVRMTYLECIGFEQMTEPDGYDDKDYYSGWTFTQFDPLPALGENAYHYMKMDMEKFIMNYRKSYSDEYSYAYRLIMQMSRCFNENSVDSFALRMTLPNIIGRLIKKCKHRDNPEMLAMELFMRVNKVNVESVLKKAAKKQKRRFKSIQIG